MLENTPTPKPISKSTPKPTPKPTKPAPGKPGSSCQEMAASNIWWNTGSKLGLVARGRQLLIYGGM